MHTNVLFGWAWILTGLLVGAGIGLRFHEPGWLGGYDSWRRRMTRLGHISFIGTGLLNIGFGLTAAQTSVPSLASTTFILGAVTMPLVCFLAAYNARYRHLFVIPVVSLLIATIETLWSGICP